MRFEKFRTIELLLENLHCRTVLLNELQDTLYAQPMRATERTKQSEPNRAIEKREEYINENHSNHID